MQRNLSSAQKYIIESNKLSVDLGAEPPAAGGQRGFAGGAPNDAAIFSSFLQKI